MEEVVRALTRTGAVRRRGKLFFVTGRYVWLTEDGPSVQVHGLTSMTGMLRTVQHNISCDDEHATLLERAAANPSIPVRALPMIHRRLKREVTALLWKIDGYLRRWEVDPGSEPTTRVGIGAYAYEDPIVTGSLPARSRKSPRTAP